LKRADEPRQGSKILSKDTEQSYPSPLKV